MSKDTLWNRINDFAQSEPEDLRHRYSLGKDARDWKIATAKKDVIANIAFENIVPISYRPFDNRYTYYTGNSRGIYASPQRRIMQNILNNQNIALVSVARQPANTPAGYILAVENMIVNGTIRSDNVSIDSLFPLYLYPEEGTLDQTIRVNFDPKLYAQIREAAGLTGPTPAPDGTDAFRRATGDARPDDVKVFDFIYGVLHCPAYRARYAAFLKIDFPRIPFPASPDLFRTISDQGEALRRLHLMEAPAIGETPYPLHGPADGSGDSTVEKPRYEAGMAGGPPVGKVWINPDQYFDAVPHAAWEHYIGGYQPAQKWLKDRKGRALTYDDIRHYQRIIKILSETARIMAEIDMPLNGDSTAG